MAKINEINYVQNVSKIEDVSIDEFNRYLMEKPFSDQNCGLYLMDIAQILNLIPPPPAKLLDLGVGSGWTSELFSMRGYDVLGLDICKDMIELANLRSCNAKFAVCDYETGPITQVFDIAVIYDALHHAEDEFAVLQNVYDALSDGGILVTIEPGAGHSTTEESIEVMRKYGTTEKDMPFSHQKNLLEQAGFGLVKQYTRVSQLPLENIATVPGALTQARHGIALGYGAATGLTSVVVAHKIPKTIHEDSNNEIADKLMAISISHDKFVRRKNMLNSKPVPQNNHSNSSNNRLIQRLLSKIKNG